MLTKIYANYTVSISQLKRNPQALIDDAHGDIIALLNRNRPTAYIVILVDTSISNDFWCDHGIAGQSILLGATEKGLAGCFIGAINKENSNCNPPN